MWLTSFFILVFDEPEDPSNRSFFSEIIASISDVKFSYSGRYMLSRDYLTVKVWDVNMESKPVETYPVHEHLRSRLCSLYENDSIFDKFECGWNGTDSYPSFNSCTIDILSSNIIFFDGTFVIGTSSQVLTTISLEYLTVSTNISIATKRHGTWPSLDRFFTTRPSPMRPTADDATRSALTTWTTPAKSCTQCGTRQTIS